MYYKQRNIQPPIPVVIANTTYTILEFVIKVKILYTVHLHIFIDFNMVVINTLFQLYEGN